jgi:hypothetical protein
VTVGISRDTASCIAGIDEVIPCGVDLRLFHPSLGPRSTTPSILFVGTRQGRKRGDLVVALFERYVRPTLPSAELWMVCEPGESHASVSWYGKVSSETGGVVSACLAVLLTEHLRGVRRPLR